MERVRSRYSWDAVTDARTKICSRRWLGMRSWVEVSRSAHPRKLSAPSALWWTRSAEVMPVVKADAYRHGAVEVSRVLEGEGVAWLAVSNVEEGIALRQAGIAARILVMADFLPEERARLSKTFHLTPVIHSLEDLAAARVPYHLKIDSGMGRLGTRAAAAKKSSDASPRRPRRSKV